MENEPTLDRPLLEYEASGVTLGPWTSYSLRTDPRHLAFVLARYKFCAKMLAGRPTVLEIGCGDGFGLALVAQSVGHLYGVDLDEKLLLSNQRRLPHLTNVTWMQFDFNSGAPPLQVDAIYWVDVLEHLEPRLEEAFVRNILRCLKPNGVLITGTPNVTTEPYQSPQSRAQHINLKSMKQLRALHERWFHNVFMFGMNDEVLHTGYDAMCHYMWAVAAGVRLEN